MNELKLFLVCIGCLFFAILDILRIRKKLLNKEKVLLDFIIPRFGIFLIFAFVFGYKAYLLAGEYD